MIAEMKKFREILLWSWRNIFKRRAERHKRWKIRENTKQLDDQSKIKNSEFPNNRNNNKGEKRNHQGKGVDSFWHQKIERKFSDRKDSLNECPKLWMKK